MASLINANNIDGTYPVAGVDNDSQGFRTNFTNIKSNFANAKNEIEDLQAKAILKSALTSGTLNNDFAGALMKGAEIKDFRETTYNIGVASGSITLNHANGHYQILEMSDSISLAFTGVPAAGKLGRWVFQVTCTNTAHTITMPSSVSLGLKGIPGLSVSGSNRVITFDTTGTYLLQFTTVDAGTTYHILDLTRGRFIENRIISDQRGHDGDVAGMLAVDATTPALWVCIGSYDGTTYIWQKVEFETKGNEVALTSNVSTTSSSLGTITGLTFIAQERATYRFEAYIPFQNTNNSTNTFSVSFGAGTCIATIEQQTNATTFSTTVATISTTDATTSAIAHTSTATTKVARITGTYQTAPDITGLQPVGQRTISIRYATSAGTLTALAGAYMRWNKIG